MKGYASALDLGCSITPSKKCTGQAHQILVAEIQGRQKADQLLIQGVRVVSVADALGHVLADAKAMFGRLSPGPESEPQQPPSSRQRAEAVDHDDQEVFVSSSTSYIKPQDILLSSGNEYT